MCTPIWRNNFIKSGSRPFIFESWTKKGVHSFADIFDDDGLLSFQNMCRKFDLPGSSFFHLRLRSALRAYGVPWGVNLDNHTVIDWLLQRESRGLVSFIYSQLTGCTHSNTTYRTIWERDFPSQTEIECDVVWDNIFQSSKNPSHQLIHFKMCHRTYWISIGDSLLD